MTCCYGLSMKLKRGRKIGRFRGLSLKRRRENKRTYELELMRMRYNAGGTMQSGAFSGGKYSDSHLQHVVILELAIFLITIEANSTSPVIMIILT